MPVSSDLVKSMVSLLMKAGTSERHRDESGADLIVVRLNDLMVSLEERNGKKAFYGMVFEALGQDFTILPGGDVLIQAVNDETGDVDTLEVNDDEFIELLEKFLEWRKQALEVLNF